MRAALLLSLLLVIPMPACSATQPLGLQLTLTLKPTQMNATSDPLVNQSLYVIGTATVNKLPVERVDLDLTTYVDIGWSSSCDPYTLLFDSPGANQSLNFLCYFVVPDNQPNATAILTVSGSARGGGLTTNSTVTAEISVRAPQSYNQTSQNGTQSTRASPGGMNLLTPSVLAIILGVAGAGGGYYVIRRRNRRKEEAG
jgi:hypothetical protein